MKRIYILLLFLVCCKLHAQEIVAFNPDFKRATSADPVQDENFYWCTAIQNSTTLVSFLEKEPELNTLFTNRHKKLEAILSAKNVELKNLMSAYKFSEEEIENVALILKKKIASNAALQSLVKENLRPSGAYENFNSLTDPAYISATWELCARGMNHILSVYGLGEKGLYPEIDSVSYEFNSSYYKGALLMWNDMLLHKKKSATNLFYQPTLNMALALLYLNHRDESARYGPLAFEANQKTWEALTEINFDDFTYASILILGNGPENDKDTLTALGKLNLQLGVLEYQQKKAPLIIVSGGHAHPFRAPFAEAIEMKEELIKRYHIPANRILIDPYARHTTTNLRNAARLIFTSAIPNTKLGLVVTNNYHSLYVGGENFVQRCKEELGYVPALILERINATTLAFQPQIESMHQNPIDPLDP